MPTNFVELSSQNPAGGMPAGTDWGAWLQMVGGGLLRDWSQQEFGRSPSNDILIDQWGRPYVEGRPLPPPQPAQSAGGLQISQGVLIVGGLLLLAVLVLK